MEDDEKAQNAYSNRRECAPTKWCHSSDVTYDCFIQSSIVMFMACLFSKWTLCSNFFSHNYCYILINLKIRTLIIYVFLQNKTIFLKENIGKNEGPGANVPAYV